MHSKLSAPSAAGMALASLVAACVLFLALAAPNALAADEHVLDPALSLTGGSEVSSVDPIPDPGSVHPQKPFNGPCGVTTDAYGNIYVANGAGETQHENDEGKTVYDGAIDVFDSTGEFITEVSNDGQGCSIAVDSVGRMYVYEDWNKRVVRHDPLDYEPATGEIEYDPQPIVVVSRPEPGAPPPSGMALDPSNDHLYVSYDESRFEELLPNGSPAAPPSPRAHSFLQTAWRSGARTMTSTPRATPGATQPTNASSSWMRPPTK